MGCASSNSIKEEKSLTKEQKISTVPKEPIKPQEPIKSQETIKPQEPIKSQEPKPKKIPFSYYCFTEEEKKYIEELKENEEKNGGEKKDDYYYDKEKKYKVLFKKMEMDLKGDESIYKQYYVLYLKDNFDKNNNNNDKAIKELISLQLCYSEQKMHPNNLKKNGIDLNADIFIINGGFSFDCDLTEEDYKRKIIIIEVCLDMEINLFYGLIMGFLYFPEKNGSVLFHYDKNYKPGNMFADGLKRTSDNEVYGIKFESSFFSFRDIRANNYDIVKELGDIITSKFNQEEIDQINFSLNNKLVTGTGYVYLYKKMIYNLTPEKVEITGYTVFLVKDEYDEVFSSSYEHDFIINEIKINDENIPKVE